MGWITSCTPHSKHLFSSTGSGVWQYLQTGHLKTENTLAYCHVLQPSERVEYMNSKKKTNAWYKAERPSALWWTRVWSPRTFLYVFGCKPHDLPSSFNKWLCLFSRSYTNRPKTGTEVSRVIAYMKLAQLTRCLPTTGDTGCESCGCREWWGRHSPTRPSSPGTRCTLAARSVPSLEDWLPEDEVERRQRGSGRRLETGRHRVLRSKRQSYLLWFYDLCSFYIDQLADCILYRVEPAAITSCVKAVCICLQRGSRQKQAGKRVLESEIWTKKWYRNIEIFP